MRVRSVVEGEGSEEVHGEIVDVEVLFVEEGDDDLVIVPECSQLFGKDTGDHRRVCICA